jgi:hypothetical protein
MRDMATAPHCSADGSGRTEWLSNVTRIMPDSGDDPRPWLTPVASGNDRLLTFLHEATHNWCFSSTVIQAQVCLVGRAQINALAYSMLEDDPEKIGDGTAGFLRDVGVLLRAIDGDPRGRFGDDLAEVRQRLATHVFDDVLRLEVLDTLFRPLSEGLALFAEYDAVSRLQSRATSPVLAALTLNFQSQERLLAYAREDADVHETVVRAAAEVIEEARLSEWAVSTKATVLMAPFMSAGGGYLPGYLAVKSMCRHLATEDPRLASETDLALLYTRNFFYEDAVLAAELLAPPRDNAVVSANRLMRHFVGRVSEFRQVSAEDVAAFENEQDGHDQFVSAGLRYLPEEYREATALLAERLDGLPSSIAGQISDFIVRHVVEETNALMARRQVVTVMSVPVEVGEDLAVVWHGHQVLTVDPADVVTPGAGAATMDILLGMVTGSETLNRVAVISRDKEIHSVTIITAIPGQGDALRESVAASFLPRAARESMSETMNYVAEMLVSADLTAHLDRERVRAALRHNVGQIYAVAAVLDSAGEDAVDLCVDLMAEKGLRPMLGSIDAVRGAAFLGLVAGLNPDRVVVEDLFRERGMDLSALLAALDGAEELYGFPPAPTEENGLLSPYL